MTPRLEFAGLSRAAVATVVVALAAIAAVPPERGPASAPPPEITWEPERPAQGTLFRVRVRPDAGDGLTEVTGEAGGEVLHFTRVPNGAFESLAPVPVDAEGQVDVTLRLLASDGTAATRTVGVPVAPGAFRHEELTVAPELGGPLSPERQARLDRDREKAREVSRLAGVTPRLWSAEMTLPRDARVTSGFGNGRIFNGQVSSRHLGLDLDGEPGDTVVAVTGGVVALVDDFLLAGNIVYLNHGAGLLSGYFHLSEPLVEEGDTVRAGTPVGRVGATGRVTGPHLHWVVRYGTTSVDPRSLIAVAGG
ncbi:MAG: M23 family metallopeptidase [Gemmatimonadota bacterium]|jgi:hypothetical protein